MECGGGLQAVGVLWWLINCKVSVSLSKPDNLPPTSSPVGGSPSLS